MRNFIIGLIITLSVIILSFRHLTNYASKENLTLKKIRYWCIKPNKICKPLQNEATAESYSE